MVLHALVRRLRLAGIALVALVAGCGINSLWDPALNVGVYGMPMPKEIPDPDLRIVSLEYEPANSITAGSEVTFALQVNKQNDAVLCANVYVGQEDGSIPSMVKQQLNGYLFDSGVAPDEIARDGIFTGTMTLPPDLGARSGLSVVGYLQWRSQATPPSFGAKPMDIGTAEDLP